MPLLLDHERMDVYQVARELSREIYRITRERPRPGRANIMDQVFRATASIPLNIAEGASETSIGRKAYFYRIARASSTELSAGLDHMADMGLIVEAGAGEAKSKIVP